MHLGIKICNKRDCGDFATHPLVPVPASHLREGDAERLRLEDTRRVLAGVELGFDEVALHVDRHDRRICARRRAAVTRQHADL